jgi:hypothetical protein
MNDTNKTIFKNASFLMGSQLIPWGLLLALIVFYLAIWDQQQLVSSI